MKQINKVSMIKVKYIAPTNTRGSRVQISSSDVRHRNADKPKKLYFGYDYAFGDCALQAADTLEKFGFEILGLNTSDKNEDYFFVKWDWTRLEAFFKLGGKRE